MAIEFNPPVAPPLQDAKHHDRAAAGNAAVAETAKGELRAALSRETDIKRILLKAAAGAGKSYVLKTLVEDAVNHVDCQRVAVVAFQNRQLWPLARDLGSLLGQESVTLLTAKGKSELVPDDVHAAATVVETESAIPPETKVVISTSHKLGRDYGRTLKHLGPARNGTAPFDVLFVDEAWQLPHHLFDPIENKAPIAVGVGDVGQLPPLEIGTNPWRGDPGFNPYRAWPTNFYGDPETVEIELPAVWRPTGEQLGLWRAFYPEWESLNCIFAPGDKRIRLGELARDRQGSLGPRSPRAYPTLIEVEGLPDAEAADVDTHLVDFAADLLDALFEADFALEWAAMGNGTGTPTGETRTVKPGDEPDDTLVTILASRNQAVDDAKDAVERLQQAARTDRQGPDRLNDRLVAGADERHHGRHPPAHRRSGPQRVQLPLRPARGHLHARHPRAPHAVPPRPRPAAPRSARQAGHAVRRAGQPPPSTPDPPAHPRLLRARDRHSPSGPLRKNRPVSRLNDLLRQVANSGPPAGEGPPARNRRARGPSRVRPELRAAHAGSGRAAGPTRAQERQGAHPSRARPDAEEGGRAPLPGHEDLHRRRRALG